MTNAEAATMTERLIEAAVSYENSSGIYSGPARKELFEARAAIESALCGVVAKPERIPARFGGHL